MFDGKAKRTKNKILTIAWSKNNGGADTICNNLKQGFHDKGYAVDTLYTNLFNCVEYETSDGRTKTYRNIDEFLNDSQNDREMKNYLAIHNHTIKLNGNQIDKLKDKTKSPMIYTVHSFLFNEIMMNPENVEYFEYLRNLPTDARRKEVKELMSEGAGKDQATTIEKADQTIVMTSKSKEYMEFYFPDHVDKCTVVNNGSDFYKLYNDATVNLEASNFRQRVGKNTKVILFSGRLYKQKGVYELADAFNEIKKLIPEAMLVYAGEAHDAACIQEIKRTIRPENLIDVLFTGWISKEKLAGIYKASDITIMPSYSETFCLSALESMMMGTPVAISHIEGPQEAFIDKMYAYGIRMDCMVPDIVKWSTMVLKEDTAIAKNNAQAVKRAATNDYSVDKMVSSTLDVYVKAAEEMFRHD